MKRLINIFAALCLLLAGATAAAQTKDVSGRITGNDGEILAGATVLNNASGAWAVADGNGRYTIAAASGNTLTFAFFGYDDLTLTVGASNVLDAVLPAAASMMLEETVVIGYGKTTKKEITGSVSSLKAEDLDVGAYTNAGGMLQGKVAGLSVVNPDGGDLVKWSRMKDGGVEEWKIQTFLADENVGGIFADACDKADVSRWIFELGFCGKPSKHLLDQAAWEGSDKAAVHTYEKDADGFVTKVNKVYGTDDPEVYQYAWEVVK